MDLRKILETVISSSPTQWHTISCWGSGSGPSYRDHLQFWEVYETNKAVMRVESHGEVAVYIPDASITMAWGLDIKPDFKENWTNRFPDPKASSHWADLFFNNALVFRCGYVVIDGARGFLPIPHPRMDAAGAIAAWEVPEAKCRFVRLLDSIRGSVSEFDYHFKQAGLSIIDEAWPKWPED